MQSHSDRNSSVPLGQRERPTFILTSTVFTASLTSRGYSKASIAYRLTLLRDLRPVDATAPDGSSRRIQRGANPAIPSLPTKAR